MKHTYYKIIFLLLGISLFFSACKKEKEVVPTKEIAAAYIADYTGKIWKLTGLDQDQVTANIIHTSEQGEKNLATNDVTQKLYWRNSFTDSIYVMNYDGTGFQGIIACTGGNGSITLDTRNDKVYWSEDDVIKVANGDGTNIQNVTSVPDNARIISIAVNSEQNVIFWCDVNNLCIGKANLLGEDANYTLIENTVAYAIALDAKNNKFYWADVNDPQESKIKSASYQGHVDEFAYADGSMVGYLALHDSKLSFYYTTTTDIRKTDTRSGKYEVIFENQNALFYGIALSYK